jgi:hypothetical protein
MVGPTLAATVTCFSCNVRKTSTASDRLGSAKANGSASSKRCRPVSTRLHCHCGRAAPEDEHRGRARRVLTALFGTRSFQRPAPGPVARSAFPRRGSWSQPSQARANPGRVVAGASTTASGAMLSYTVTVPLDSDRIETAWFFTTRSRDQRAGSKGVVAQAVALVTCASMRARADDRRSVVRLNETGRGVHDGKGWALHV